MRTSIRASGAFFCCPRRNGDGPYRITQYVGDFLDNDVVATVDSATGDAAFALDFEGGGLDRDQVGTSLGGSGSTTVDTLIGLGTDGCGAARSTSALPCSRTV